jgi:hypothetical protein
MENKWTTLTCSPGGEPTKDKDIEFLNEKNGNRIESIRDPLSLQASTHPHTLCDYVIHFT